VIKEGFLLNDYSQRENSDYHRFSFLVDFAHWNGYADNLGVAIP